MAYFTTAGGGGLVLSFMVPVTGSLNSSLVSGHLVLNSSAVTLTQSITVVGNVAIIPGQLLQVHCATNATYVIQAPYIEGSFESVSCSDDCEGSVTFANTLTSLSVTVVAQPCDSSSSRSTMIIALTVGIILVGIVVALLIVQFARMVRAQNVRRIRGELRRKEEDMVALDVYVPMRE